MEAHWQTHPRRLVMKLRWIHVLTSLSFGVILLILSCAQVEAPSGGPEDKSAPRVAGIYPAQQATNVSTEFQSIIEFNEWIDSRINFRHATISPPLTKPLQLRADANRLYITSVDSLEKNTTYTITISTALKDLRNNPMPKPFSLTFSTGPQIDTLSLTGFINGMKNSKVPPATLIALYPIGSQRSEFKYLQNIIDSITPEIGPEPVFQKELPMYTTEADTSGYFQFQGLQKGNYRILAFTDQNSNRLIEINQEQVAFFSQDITIDGTDLPITLSLSSIDTSGLLPEQITPLPDNQVQLVFNHPPHWPSSSNAELYRLKIQGQDSTILPQIVYEDPRNSMPVLKFDTLYDQVDYELQIGSLKDSSDKILDTLYRVQPFTAVLDTSPIKVKLRIPDFKTTGVDPRKPQKMYFDRPLEFSEDKYRFMLVVNGDTIPHQTQQDSPISVEIQSTQPLGNAATVELYKLIADTLLEVNSNNQLDTLIQDKASLINRYSTLDLLKTTSLQGSIPSCDTQSKVRLYFGKKEHLTECDPEGQFLFKQVEVGTWFLESYQDLNSNNKRDIGRLIPFEHSEPYFNLPDTLYLNRDSINYLDSLLPNP